MMLTKCGEKSLLPKLKIVSILHLRALIPVLCIFIFAIPVSGSPVAPGNDTIPDPLIYNVLNKRFGLLVPDSAKVWESVRVIDINRVSLDSTVVTFTLPSLREELGLVSVNRNGYHTITDGLFLKPRFAVKTNLLYWFGITPDAERTTLMYNFSIEYFLTPDWSLEAGFRYSNRSYNDDEEFQGISGYHIEPRYYCSLSPSRSVSLYWGVYGRLGDYNMRETQQPIDHTAKPTFNRTGKYWDAGLSCGIHLRLFRGLGLEAGCRSGYVHSRSTVYTLHDGHNCFAGYEPYRKVRVTDLMFNLVYRFH